jgi:putative CocE/NonD family hydrolase
MSPVVARGVVATVALFVTIACGQPVGPTDDRISSFGMYEGYSEARYDGSNRYSVYVPMPDGTRIAVDYFLPTLNGVEASEPLPVILHYTRYIRAFETDDGLVGKDRDPILKNMLAHGYAVAAADSRGTGASFGTHTGSNSREETEDSYHIIEWLAAQPWCDGNVGMHGRSYPGMTQYHATTQAPPALKAVFPEMAGTSSFDFVFRGGTYKEDFIKVWGETTRKMDYGEYGTAARVDADEDGSMRDAAVATHGDNFRTAEVAPQALYRDWKFTLSADRVGGWNEITVIDNVADFDRSGVAVYHLVGWYDIYTTQQPWLFTNISSTPQKMMIGPWTHSGGYGGEIHMTEFLRWYDYWLKGIDNSIMDEPPVHYFVMPGNNTLLDDLEQKITVDEREAEDSARWTSSDGWPPPGIESSGWYLAAGPSGTVDSTNDGILSNTPPDSAAADEYTVDYTSTSGAFNRWRNGYGGRREIPERSTFFDERTPEDEKALTYTSVPMTEDLTLLGYPLVHLWVSSSHSDGDFFVYLEEVDAEGKSNYLSEGAMRASYRALCEAPFDNFSLPYPCGLEARLADLPDEPVELMIDLMGVGHVIQTGHRIRVTITGADAANHALYPDPEGGAPTVSIHRSPETASMIELPVFKGEH